MKNTETKGTQAKGAQAKSTPAKGKQTRRAQGSSAKTILTWGVAALAVIVVAGFLIFGSKDNGGSGGDLLIPKSDISEQAQFYPYKVGNTKMEVVAVKAPDGTIRTAFNTCQVCYDSGKGYYIQDGDELVCQNCGNRFKTSDVEVVHGGCNPVPILDQDKTDDGTNLVVSQAFLEANKGLFLKWKK